MTIYIAALSQGTCGPELVLPQIAAAADVALFAHRKVSSQTCTSEFLRVVARFWGTSDTGLCGSGEYRAGNPSFDKYPPHLVQQPLQD